MTDAICLIADPERPLRGPQRLTSRRAVVAALGEPSRKQVWVLRGQRSIPDLIRAMSIAAPRVRGARLIAYTEPTPVAARVLESAFHRVLLGVRAMVRFADLTGILRSRNPEDFCVGVAWERETDTLALWRGDLSVLVVPMSAFRARDGVVADPSKLSIEDCGQTIRMGNYEASVDAILMDVDPLHRRKARKRAIREERTLGASIRRLRRSRGVGRADFPDLDEKTIARIERGEVSRPQRETLGIIARRLGVTVEELKGF